MRDERLTYSDRRQRGDRRSGRDRRSGGDRRIRADRRSGKDRRSAWGEVLDQRFQGVLRTTATVSHLFSQPLTVILGHVDLLASSTEEEETKEKLAIIKEQLELIGDYLHKLRELHEYKTIDFGDITLLDILQAKTRNNKQ